MPLNDAPLPHNLHPHPPPYHSLLPHLTLHLPTSLALLRTLTHPLTSSTPTAHVLATFPPLTPPPKRWAAIYVDRARAPETEAWLFTTYEVRLNRCGVGGNAHEDEEEGNEEAAETKSHLLALFRAISSLPTPNATHNRKPLILGSLHSSLIPLLTIPTHTLTPHAVLARDPPRPPDTDVADAKGSKHEAGAGGVLSQISIEYGKWLIPTTAAGMRRVELPEGYGFAALRTEELEVVVARTEIPKRVETLARLGGVGVRKVGVGGHDGGGEGEEEGRLVAWGFVGVDGSLSTLHVELSERGRGLGKAVAGRLVWMVGESEAEGGGGCGWVSGDVALGNEGSEGVMRGLGGERRWMVRWVAVDLGRL